MEKIWFSLILWLVLLSCNEMSKDSGFVYRIFARVIHTFAHLSTVFHHLSTDLGEKSLIKGRMRFSNRTKKLLPDQETGQAVIHDALSCQG